MARAKKDLEQPAGAAIPEGYTYEELCPLIGTTLGAGLSVLLRGHPGVGKSTLARELAGGLGLEMIDIRLAQRDPADLCGVYFPDPEFKFLFLRQVRRGKEELHRRLRCMPTYRALALELVDLRKELYQ